MINPYQWLSGKGGKSFSFPAEPISLQISAISYPVCKLANAVVGNSYFAGCIP
jgi:hypothetical protein